MAVFIGWTRGESGIIDMMDMPPVDGPIIINEVRIDEPIDHQHANDTYITINYESPTNAPRGGGT